MKKLIKVGVVLAVIFGGIAAYHFMVPRTVEWKEGKIFEYPICPVCGYEFSLSEIGVERCPKCGAPLKWEKLDRLKKEANEAWDKTKEIAAEVGEKAKEGAKSAKEEIEEKLGD